MAFSQLELHAQFKAMGNHLPRKLKPAILKAKLKEASAEQLRHYREQFKEAKQLEIKSWKDNEVYELIDTRKIQCRNFVTGRWVLTVKTTKDGEFLKAKARWVLRGFLDKQKDEVQTDAPTGTRPGFRMTCQLAASNNWVVASRSSAH